MEPKDEIYGEMRILICELVDGTITPDRRTRLNQILANDPEAVKHYIDFLDIQVLIKSNVSNIKNDFSAPLFSDEIQGLSELWHQLAKEERFAPEINLPKEQPQRELIQKVIYPLREKREVSRSSIVFLVMSTAAILSIVLFLKYAPRTHGVEVATLTDGIHAKWVDIDSSMQTGTRLTSSSDKLLLREGLAELTFDNQTKAVIEAPAEFQILADDRIGLTYGKVYAVVPSGAIGFSVYTPNAKIVDLGTEFGVKAEANGDTQLYVLKGKTSLIAGEESNRASIEVTENSAKRVSGVTQEISDIPYNSRLFVREIDSRNQIAWRGENLELASIIAGGNGFDPVLNEQTLNPNTGEYEIKPLVSSEHPTNYSYNRVSGNTFIDGVFVPDGSHGPVTITSRGHQFDCPATSGKINRDIAVFYKQYNKTSSDMQPALFDGILYGSEKQPCVLLHSNVGITIDLDRIRQAYPGRTIEKLQTGYGLTWAEKNGRADFFILVDGVLKREDRALASQENSQSVSIQLEPDARFLTFIVTDDQKSSRSSDRPYEFDFFYLLDPQLVLR